MMRSSSHPDTSPCPSNETIHTSDQGYITNFTELSFHAQDDSSSRSGDDEDQMDGLEVYGKESRRLMKVIKHVRSLGVEEGNDRLPLPKLCVVGDQSTGKSSVIEAISQIRLPRAAGTCTRCPMEINLSNSSNRDGQWFCQVSLVKKYIYVGRGKANIGMDPDMSRERLGPWVPTKPQSESFYEFDDRTKTAEIIRWAQAATLNPHMKSEEFRPGYHTRPDLTSLKEKFSPNVVRLDICGPNLPNLLFYDLPGVIANEKDRSTVDMISKLAKRYIGDENCIVLHVLAMTNDIQNASSGHLVRGRKGPVVGVLTKPDGVRPRDAFEPWVKVLKGEEWALPLGYYVVKNSDKSDTSHEVARTEEMEWFGKNEPFQSELGNLAHRFGIPNLQKALSGLLATQIKQSLPQLIKNAKKRVEDIEATLETLPQRITGNISLLVDKLLTSFEKQLTMEIAGGSVEHSFFSDWQKVVKTKRDILVQSYPLLRFPLATVPTPTTERSTTRGFRAGSSDSTATGTGLRPVVIGDDDDNTAQVGQKRSRPNQPPRSPFSAKRAKLDRPEVHPQARRLAKTFSVAEVQILLDRVNPGVPDTRSIEVTEQLYKRSVGHWDGIMQDISATTAEMTKDLVHRYLKQIFVKQKETAMMTLITDTCSEFLATACERQSEALNDYLKMEKECMVTLDVESIRDFKRQEIEFLNINYRDSKYNNIVKRYYPDSMSAAKAKEVEAEIEKAAPDFENEITEIATARSYYKCASRRFIDNLVLSIRTLLFQNIRDDLPHKIKDALGLENEDANARLIDLLEPDPVAAKRRNDLEEERGKLTDAIRRLQRVEKYTHTKERDAQSADRMSEGC